MRYVVSPSCVKGGMVIPPSKSQTLRALLFAAVAKGRSRILSPLFSPDTEAMIQAITSLGAKVERTPEGFEVEGVEGRIELSSDLIDVGNSGIVLRFFSALASLSSTPFVITGDASIQKNRKMGPLLEGLQALGVRYTYLEKEGYAPVRIQGPLQPGKTVIWGEDSQPVSALLIASSLVKGRTEIEVVQPGETPWVEVTLQWLSFLGISYEREGFHRFILPGSAAIEPFTYRVPGDWSSAAYPLAASLVTGSSLTLYGLDVEDSQGDKEILSILEKMGASFSYDPEKNSLTAYPPSLLQGGAIDVNRCIDALPILAVLGCFAEGETHLYGASSARYKECDRLSCMTQELRKMGAAIEELPGGLKIRKSALHGASLSSHRDHRIALSLAVAALGALGGSVIEEVECVAKTFSSFASSFQKLGASIIEK